MGFVDLRIFVLRQVVCTGHLFRNQTKPSKSLNQFMRQSGTAKKAGSGFPSAGSWVLLLLHRRRLWLKARGQERSEVAQG